MSMIHSPAVDQTLRELHGLAAALERIPQLHQTAARLGDIADRLSDHLTEQAPPSSVPFRYVPPRNAS